MNVTDKQLATEGGKRCVCCINGINRPENGFWVQLTVSRRHFYFQLVGSGCSREIGQDLGLFVGKNSFAGPSEELLRISFLANSSLQLL